MSEPAGSQRFLAYRPADVQKLVHVIRTPTWVIPPRVQVFAMGAAGEVLKEIEMDREENFSQAQIDKFRSDPQLYRRFVKAIEREVNGAFPIVSMLSNLVTLSASDTLPRYSRTAPCRPSPASTCAST